MVLVFIGYFILSKKVGKVLRMLGIELFWGSLLVYMENGYKYLF